MKILVATDGSRPAVAAVRFAAGLCAAVRGSRLEVLLVGDAGSDLIGQGGAPAVRSPMAQEYRRWARGALDRARWQALRLGVVARGRYVEASLAPVASVIARAGDALRADLIVVGSAGRGAIGRALLGSVARRLIHQSTRPIVVVPHAVAARRGRGLRILAATDGSAASTAAIRLAASLARRAQEGSLAIVTVGTLRRDLALGFSSAVLALLPYGELRSAERQAAQRILGKAARAARSRGVRARLRFLEPRTPRPIADELAAEARRAGARLIAVGSVGRGSVEAWAMGSVAHRLLSVARRPVLLVRGPRSGR